jgi:NAD(P)-dependent dehydrogenase (short-subunit alcohol dehydrogenase family)
MGQLDGRLHGKVALVTGGANGIGLACVQRFAQEGARVVIADVLDDPGESAAVDLRGEGHEAIFVHLDAASPADNEAAVVAAVRDFGSLDIVVTAAGISFAGYTSGEDRAAGEITAASASATPSAAFLNLPVEAWQPVLDVNLTGTLLAIQAAGKQMVSQPNGGSIVTIASIAALAGEAGSLAYSVSKAGVWMVTKMAAVALATEGVRVNAIGPGYIETNMTKIIATIPDFEAKLLDQVPMRRFGKPSEIANVALFLASDDASYVTGELFIADGGYYTH